MTSADLASALEALDDKQRSIYVGALALIIRSGTQPADAVRMCIQSMGAADPKPAWVRVRKPWDRGLRGTRL